MIPALHFKKPGRPLFRVAWWVMVVTIAGILSTNFKGKPAKQEHITVPRLKAEFVWTPPDHQLIPGNEAGELIRYGKDLIARTSYYWGPKGRIAPITNGMNCQNCHLDAGTRLYGNNYSAVFSIYPKFRERSGTIENIYKRVNDCLERSLNGSTIDTNSREMQAIAAYINWLGHAVPRDIKPAGAGISNLPFPDRPADPGNGRIVYVQYCRRCHGNQGEGVSNSIGDGYTYPPLWGKNSYTTAAGLFRISRLAGYVKDNMPFGVSQQSPQLSNGEAWDVAAFINSQPRPVKVFEKDWPDLAGKPVDHPFGPYADRFPATQHKYGPFKPIQAARDSMQYHRSKNK